MNEGVSLQWHSACFCSQVARFSRGPPPANDCLISDKKTDWYAAAKDAKQNWSGFFWGQRKIYQCAESPGVAALLLEPAGLLNCVLI